MTESVLDISSVLNTLIKLYNISEAELARKINIPRPTINGLASGRTHDPRMSTISAIAEYFEVSVDQLLGKAPLQATADKFSLVKTQTYIPILGLQQIDNWAEKITGLNHHNHSDWISADPAINQAKFAIRIDGEAMWPQFQENTILIIAPDLAIKNRDFILAHISSKKEIIFRQLIIDGSYKFLHAINPIFPTIQLDEADTVMGTVIQTRKNF